MLFYIVVRKTKKQTAALLNTGFNVKLAREKLDGLKSTYKATFQLPNRDYLTRTRSCSFKPSSARQRSRRLHFSKMDLTGSLRARSCTGKKGTHKASFQQPNRDYLMITLFFHYIIPNRKTKKQTTALLCTGFNVKLALRFE